MQITVHARHFDMTDAIRDYAETHLTASITKYFADPETTDISFVKDSHRFTVEIRVHLGKKMDVVAHGEAHDAYVAFDEALEHISKKIRRHKRKITDYHKTAIEKQAMQAQYYVIDSVEEDDDDSQDDVENSDTQIADDGAPVIIAEEAMEIKSLTVSVAVASLDLSGRNAMLFKNSANDRLSMVYVRPDGNIGWVEPHLEN